MTKTILISGAGIAGPTLAFWLKAAGFQPTLVEHSPALRSGGYVIDFWGLGYDIAERMGLIHDVNRAGYHIQEMAEFGGSGWECRHILAALDAAPELYVDRVSQIRMPHWSRGRIALVGDAAYCVSLAAGQGSALAMTGATARRRTRQGGRSPRRSFRQLRENFARLHQPQAAGAERFASAFAPKTRLGLRFRNLVVKAAAIPGVARLTFGRDIIDSLRLPDYHWPC